MTEESEEKENEGEDYRKVMKTVRDYIYEYHEFPQIRDITNITNMPRTRCKEVVDQLINQKQLYMAFGKKKKTLPKIILLYDMMQSVLMTQKKPDWLPKYGFSEKGDITEKIKKLQNEAIKYEQFERLLYATDIPLEEAIAYTLDWLDFEDVIHHKDDPNNPDVTFKYEGVKALLEAEGKSKAGAKDKITQLDGWITKEINGGAKASKLKGFFVINHFRDLEPKKRGDPLTPIAKQFLSYYKSFRYFTTISLLEIVKQVLENKLSKKDARKRVWEGEK